MVNIAIDVPHPHKLRSDLYSYIQTLRMSPLITGSLLSSGLLFEEWPTSLNMKGKNLFQKCIYTVLSTLIWELGLKANNYKNLEFCHSKYLYYLLLLSPKISCHTSLTTPTITQTQLCLPNKHKTVEIFNFCHHKYKNMMENSVTNHNHIQRLYNFFKIQAGRVTKNSSCLVQRASIILCVELILLWTFDLEKLNSTLIYKYKTL